jgi:hypothetical protein
VARATYPGSAATGGLDKLIHNDIENGINLTHLLLRVASALRVVRSSHGSVHLRGASRLSWLDLIFSRQTPDLETLAPVVEQKLAVKLAAIWAGRWKILCWVRRSPGFTTKNHEGARSLDSRKPCAPNYTRSSLRG